MSFRSASVALRERFTLGSQIQDALDALVEQSSILRTVNFYVSDLLDAPCRVQWPV